MPNEISYPALRQQQHASLDQVGAAGSVGCLVRRQQHSNAPMIPRAAFADAAVGGEPDGVIGAVTAPRGRCAKVCMGQLYSARELTGLDMRRFKPSKDTLVWPPVCQK